MSNELILGVAAGAVALVLAAGAAWLRLRRRGQARVTQTMETYREEIVAHTFKMPDSPDLAPSIEYGNVFSEYGSQTYELTVFDSGGIREHKKGLSQGELNALLSSGGWQLVAEQYSNTPRGRTLQFERRKPPA